MQTIHDEDAFALSGWLMLLMFPVMAVIAFTVLKPLIALVGVLFFLSTSGFTIVSPNEAKVITFFGKYYGTIKQNGFLWTVPFTAKRMVPLKLNNFITETIKVNDLNGNPIEVGAVVVWRVEDAAMACFSVDDYRSFVANQSEIAIRAIAAAHPYDSEDGMSLRGHVDEICEVLTVKLQEKLKLTGIVIEEARIAHLAYAAEIASAMLRKQQAMAVLQARKYLIENALTIVDSVVAHFEKDALLKISDDKKMGLISNLLVTITSDKEASPVLSVGA